MKIPYVVYGDNGRLLSRPVFFGETQAVSAAEAVNFIRRRKFRYKRVRDTGYKFLAYVKGSQDDLKMRARSQNMPESLLTPSQPILSSLA